MTGPVRWRAKRWAPALQCIVVVALIGAAAQVGGAEPRPVMVRTAPGRFEVAAIDPSAAHQLANVAEEAWRLLAVPLGLPESFSSPIYVRLSGPTETHDRGPFSVTVEPGGIVSVRLAASLTVTPVVRRAIVQGLLMRLAVARHGVSERLTAPLWLEHACVSWWQTRAEGAQLDAVKLRSASLPVPTIAALFSWERGGEEPEAFSAASLWMLTFLQSESTRAKEWNLLLNRLLAGEEALGALSATFPERFASAQERELWWKTGYHHVRGARTLPTLEAAESRLQLSGLARFVFGGASETADIAVPLRTVAGRTADPLVAAELARRTGELERLTSILHPFYRNAALSLAEVLRVRTTSDVKKTDALCTTFEQDFRDAIELESAMTTGLDQLEGSLRTKATRR